MGRREEWISELDALHALDPGPSREVALGLAYAETGQANRAVLTLSRAVERYPEHGYTFVALGRVWLEVAQASHDRVALRKALGALEGAVGQDDTSEALTLFGRALLLADDAEFAEHVLVQATERVPADPKAFYYLADVAQRRGHSDIARRALLDYRALEGEEDDARRRASFAVRVAELSMRVSDAPTAASWYARAVADSPADASLLVRLADAQVHAGEADAARASVAKALERDPANAAAQALRRRLR
jgi:predicted Zn-dependent protease